jgi:hypothetical protein
MKCKLEIVFIVDGEIFRSTVYLNSSCPVSFRQQNGTVISFANDTQVLKVGVKEIFEY